MDMLEKYNILESSNSFSFLPMKPVQQSSKRLLLIILAAGIILTLFREMLDRTFFFALYIVLAYPFLYCLYDIIITANVRYTFDTSTNSIYRMSPVSAIKKIMKLDEAVIFISSEMGNWHYCLGARKSQFVKNYMISENFNSGKKSKQQQEIYESRILIKINDMIVSSPNSKS